MDLFKMWELIEFIPPEHLHSDEILENPHFGVASNDEPLQIDLKCPNGRCFWHWIYMGFTTWIMFNSRFTQWEHGPRKNLIEIWMRTWPRPRLPKIPPDSMPTKAAIVHPHASRIECVNPPSFIPHDSYGCVQKKQGVYIYTPKTHNDQSWTCCFNGCFNGHFDDWVALGFPILRHHVVRSATSPVWPMGRSHSASLRGAEGARKAQCLEKVEMTYINFWDMDIEIDIDI